MIILKFKDKKEFEKAIKFLKKAIDTIGTDKFDFNNQPENKTISVSEKVVFHTFCTGSVCIGKWTVPRGSFCRGT